MDPIQVVSLALLQGLTEFLPVSSSGHLALLPSLVDWPDQGLAFDVSVHIGTLIAVLAYFRNDLRIIVADWIRSVAFGREVGASRLGWSVILATVPGGAAGFVLNQHGVESLRSPTVIGLATVLFGVLLWWADRRGSRQRDERHIGWADVVVIGCAQALALIPGVSRSGVTITAAMAMGLTRAGAARFSFLLSIPIIAAAGGLKVVDAATLPGGPDWLALGGGASISAVSAYLCIHYFLKLLDRVGMAPFAIYRLVLGGIILALA